jgi:hypothetical protein
VTVRVLTWHVHGNYLWYLSHVPVTWLLPVRPGHPPGYGGRAGSIPWPDNVVEVPAEDVRHLDVDAVVCQSHANWRVDRHDLLSPAQLRRIPQILVEHDPPRESPTDTVHPVDDPDARLVHVTHYNDLMWDAGRTPTRVIDHGVVVPDGLRATHRRNRGIVVVNDLDRRGRRLGADLVTRVRQEVPLDIVGMGSERIGGLGEIPPPDLAAFMAQYRFFFHPARYTSLGLAVCEAMAIGLPVVGLATTELPTVITNGVSGWVSTDVSRLVDRMHELVADPDEAARLGDGARRVARRRFGIDRFVRDWLDVLASEMVRARDRAGRAGVQGGPC